MTTPAPTRAEVEAMIALLEARARRGNIPYADEGAMLDAASMLHAMLAATDARTLTDNALLKIARKCQGDTLKLTRTVWKDGIDIDEPSYALRNLVEDVMRAMYDP